MWVPALVMPGGSALRNPNFCIGILIWGSYLWGVTLRELPELPGTGWNLVELFRVIPELFGETPELFGEIPELFGGIPELFGAIPELSGTV